MQPGILYGVLAYTAWGLFPIFFKQLSAVNAFEVVLHRTVWSMVFVVGVLALRRWGYQVLTAPSGTEALAVWAAHKTEISLLLTDIIMPGGISGLELARRLLAENPRLRVIYSSGYSAEIAGRDLGDLSAVNFLPKPFNVDALRQMVGACIRRRA